MNDITNPAICAKCFNNLSMEIANCPECGTSLVWDGDYKSVIDRIEPNCLIYRYEGSDLLEAASIIKEARTNFKVATKLNEYLKPVNIPKTKVFKFDAKILGAIQSLRNERSATIHRYDHLIKKHWEKLKPYEKDYSPPQTDGK